MSLGELFLLAVGLSMDAFAAAVCKGLAAGRAGAGRCLCCGLWFGGAQAAMPVLGWLLGVRFQGAIARVDHWAAFLLLAGLGLHMMCSAGEEDGGNASFSPRAMLPLAAATSIDALAVGITFAFLRVEPLPAAGVIGGTTFCLSALGAAAGGVCGSALRARASQFGGGLLILLGIRILLEHLGGFSPASLAFFPLI